MPPSQLDTIYRRMLITRFFEKGWGKPENLQKLFEFRKEVSNRQKCYQLVPPDYPIEITKEEKYSDYHVIEGKFITPLELYLPGLVPEAAKYATFQMLLPQKWPDERFKPVCVHFAGTGDHFFWRRRNFIAKPLLREAGIGAILLENPFYGYRKPQDQIRSNLNNVSDIFVMGGCLVLENLVLLHWCERMGLGPLGVTGLSMGGHNASLAATNWPRPLVLVPCLSWSTASSVFTQGVMSQSINWDTLETQYYSDGHYCERLAKMVTVVDDSFLAGQKFAKNFNQSMRGLRQDIASTHDHAASSISPTISNTVLSPTAVQSANTIADNAQQLVPTDPDVSTKSLGVAATISSAILLSTTALTNLIQPLTSVESKIDPMKTNWWEHEALQFMRGVMDECTHLKNFSVPYDTSLITAICAKEDAYIPREGCTSIEEVWPGAEVKYLDAGHVSAYVLHQKIFRSSIIENFERAKAKYDPNLVGDAQKPTITFDELYAQYIDRISASKKSEVRRTH